MAWADDVDKLVGKMEEENAKLKAMLQQVRNERDSYRRDFDACAHAIDKLQADLDAALDWIEGLGGPMGRTTDLDRRVLSMLDKRREQRG